MQQTAIDGSIYDCGYATAVEGLSRRCGEEIAQRLDWRIFHDEAFADAARQDQGDAAVADLLVLAHVAEEAIGRDARERDLGQPRRQAAVFEMAAHPRRILRRDQLDAEYYFTIMRRNLENLAAKLP